MRELAWLLGIPVSTLEDKLADRHPPRLDTERLVDMIEMALARGYAPPGWPLHLWRQVDRNTLPDAPPLIPANLLIHDNKPPGAP